jgi:hypothetical protein
VRVIFCTSHTVDIKGIDNHHVNNICIGTVGGVVNTQKGPVIAIMHQYVLLGKGASIHSPSQLEWYKNDVNDKAVHVPGGLQRLTTMDGYVIPLIIKDGLARLDIWPHTDHEHETLPHVFLTFEVEWDPTVMDHEFTDESQWGEDNLAIVDLISASAYDEFGQYRHRVIVNKHVYFSRFNSDDIDDHIDQCVVEAHSTEIEPDPSTINVPKTINKKSRCLICFAVCQITSFVHVWCDIHLQSNMCGSYPAIAASILHTNDAIKVSEVIPQRILWIEEKKPRSWIFVSNDLVVVP